MAYAGLKAAVGLKTGKGQGVKDPCVSLEYDTTDVELHYWMSQSPMRDTGGGIENEDSAFWYF